MFKRKLWVFIWLLLLSGMFTGEVLAQSASTKGKQVIVVVDRLSLKELTDSATPNLVKLQQIGSMALMNTNAVGTRESANTYMTIANGQRTGGGEWAGSFYKVTDLVYDNFSRYQGNGREAGLLYTSLTGWTPSNNQFVNPGIMDIIAKNSALKYGVQVGSLGEQLKVAGVDGVVVGNSDTHVPHRFAAALIMDRKGRVSAGYINDTALVADNGFPTGKRTDYLWTLQKTTDLLANKDLVIIELGDLFRLEETRDLTAMWQYTNLRNTTLGRVDEFIGELLPKLNLEQDQLMLLVPSPAVEELKVDNMVTPLIIAGSRFPQGGLLTSASTRRQGIVANTDVAPSILEFYGQEKAEEMIGRQAFGINFVNSLEFLKGFNERLVDTYAQRPLLLRGTAVLEIIVIISALLVIKYAQKLYWYRWFRRFALMFFVIPIVMLFYHIIQVSSVTLATIITLVTIALGVLIVERVPISNAAKLGFLAISTSLAIIVDTLLGSTFIMSSPLGYDVMLGSRYYGIGNEFTGILMGATLLGLGALLELVSFTAYRRLLTLGMAAYLGAITYILFAPSLGADAGGVITALVAFVYFLMEANDKKITVVKALVLGSVTLAVLFAGALLDLKLNGAGQSHIGQAMGKLMQGGWEQAWFIIQRKLAMNWKLIQYSIWSRVLLATIIGLAFFMFHPKGIFKVVEKSYPLMYKGIKASIVASLVGFAVNDSGVVQAATTAVYVIFPLIYLVLDEKMHLQES